jgi:hypothetical protein
LSPDWHNDSVVSDEDVHTAERLIDAYDEAAADLDYSDDSKVRTAIRNLAEAGSGIPLSSWMPLTMTGDQASDRAWQWLATCAAAAAGHGNHAFPVKLGVFAHSWNDLAPDPTPADPVELGLMKPPVEILSVVLSQSVLAARALPADILVGHFGEQQFTASFAQTVHADLLLALESTGVQIDADAKAAALAAARS